MGEIDDTQRAKNKRKAHGAEGEVPGRTRPLRVVCLTATGTARNGERIATAISEAASRTTPGAIAIPNETAARRRPKPR